VSGTELSGPDYVALARSFGAYAERVDTTEAFAAAFDRARHAGRSAVLELPTDPDQITPDRRLLALDQECRPDHATEKLTRST